MQQESVCGRMQIAIGEGMILRYNNESRRVEGIWQQWPTGHLSLSVIAIDRLLHLQ